MGRLPVRRSSTSLAGYLATARLRGRPRRLRPDPGRRLRGDLRGARRVPLPVPQGAGDQPLPVPLLPAAALPRLDGAAVLVRRSSGWPRSTTRSGPGVAYLAHVVGFALGFLYAWVRYRSGSVAGQQAERRQPRPPRETASRDHRDRAHQDQRGPDPRDRRVDRRAGQRQRGLLGHRHLRPGRHGAGRRATTTWRTSSRAGSARSRASRPRTRTSRSARTPSTTWRRRSRSASTPDPVRLTTEGRPEGRPSSCPVRYADHTAGTQRPSSVR